MKYNSPNFLRISDETLRGARPLTNAKGITAMALLDGGRRIITSEKYGNHGACLALYDADSLRLLREFVFAEDTPQPYAIGVVSDPDRIIIDVGERLRLIDLRDASCFGESLPMRFWFVSPEWEWLAKKLTAGEALPTAAISIFDGGKIATVHCGVAAQNPTPRMPNYLVSWDLVSFQLKAGPVQTPNRGAMSTDDMASGRDIVHRQFITGQRHGWVRFWDIDTLQLVREFHIESPPSCDRKLEGMDNHQIYSIALSNNVRIIALGTWSGAIHVLDRESGRDLVGPLIPHDFDYTSTNENGGWPPHYAEEVTSLEFFANDRRLVAGYKDGSLRVWDVASGIEVGETLGLKDRQCHSPDMLWILPQFRKAISAQGGRPDENVRVWDLESYFP
jgi:WD40 repeat protein